MARILLTFLAVVYLLFNSLTFKVVISRRIVDAERVHHIRVADPKDILDDPAGTGHGYTNYKSLAAIKNSGPSPGGKGHAFSNAESLGGIKNSGPSSGGSGHGSPSAGSLLGDMKNSGPSEGGKGHGFRNNEMVQEIHNSSPTLGAPKQMFTNSFQTHGNHEETKAQVIPNFGNLGNIKNSGPSSGGKGH